MSSSQISSRELPARHARHNGNANTDRLLDTGKFSDFTITCQGREWKVHKAIVCSQSDAMEAVSRFGKVCTVSALDGFGLLTSVQEAEEAKIDLPEEDPEIVEYIRRFMYERDYRLPSDDVPGPHWVDFNCDKLAKGYNITDQETIRSAEVGFYDYSAAALQILRARYPGLSENPPDQPGDTGSLILVRKDGKSLHPMHVQALISYTATKLKDPNHPTNACLPTEVLLADRITQVSKEDFQMWYAITWKALSIQTALIPSPFDVEAGSETDEGDSDMDQELGDRE